MIEITDVKLEKVNNEEGRTKAIADIVIGGCISINGIKLLEDKYDNSKIFLAMPSKRLHSGEFKEFANPTNAEARKLLTEILTEVYNETE